MVKVKNKFASRLKDDMFKMGLPSQNTAFECMNNACTIDTNGNYLYCDRIRSNTVGNMFDNDFNVLCKRSCIYYRNIKNFYKANDSMMKIQVFGN